MTGRKCIYKNSSFLRQAKVILFESKVTKRKANESDSKMQNAVGKLIKNINIYI